jgi:two-component sensor histidine kinase
MSSSMPTPVSFTFESADFHFAPTELPSPETNLDTFLAECNRKINWLICEAWQGRALPVRTRLVQCLTTSPIRKVSFENPWILQRAKPTGNDRVRLLGAFAHTTWHLKEQQASSHARVRKLGDTSRGTIVIFTKLAPEHEQPRGISHLLHFGFPPANWEKRLDFTDCANDLLDKKFYCSQILGKRFENDYEAFDANEFVKYANSKQFESIVKEKPAPAKWCGFPSPAMFAENAKQIKGSLFQNIQTDEPYQNRVAALLEYGAIVLCIPQSFRFAQSPVASEASDGSFILDSGLTVILDDDAPPTLDDLRQINAVAHKISLFIASTYGLATSLARHETSLKLSLVARAIDHELRNATANVSAILNTLVRSGQPVTQGDQLDIKARLNTAKAALDALTDVAQPGEKKPMMDEFLTVTKTFANYRDFTLKVQITEESQRLNPQMSSAFRLLLTELIRNAYKHNPSQNVRKEKCIATVKLELSDGFLKLCVENPTDRDSAFTDGNEPVLANTNGLGLALVTRLCEELKAEFSRTIDSHDIASVAVKIPIMQI